LRAVSGTDAMSRPRAEERLAEQEICVKSTDHYVDVVEQANLGESPHFGLQRARRHFAPGSPPRMKS